MRLDQQREELFQYIQSADDRVIQLIYAMMKEDRREQDHKKQHFMQQIMEAESQIDNGDYLDLDDFEKSSDQWD